MSNKASEPNTSGAANTSEGTGSTHEPQNLLDATPRTGSIPLHLGEGGADSGKTQPEKSLNRRILALAVPAFGALIAEPLFVLADSALVGQLGTETLAGMSIAATLITTVVGLMNFLAYSVTPAVARAFGAHRLAHAYRIGVDGNRFRANDDGEPAGSAGRPILGQIDSFGLTDVLVVVVRYFGGTLLGVPGLIRAYKSSTEMALREAQIIEKNIEKTVLLRCEYPHLSQMLTIGRQHQAQVLEQDLQLDCRIVFSIPLSSYRHCLDAWMETRQAEIIEQAA